VINTDEKTDQVNVPAPDTEGAETETVEEHKSGGGKAQAEATETSQQAQPSEPLYEIKVRGETKKVPINELIELAQKGTDYTIKTQELSQKAKEMAQEMAPEIARELILKAFAPTGEEGEEEIDPVVKEIQNLKTELDTLKREQADRQLQELVGKLKEKYPKMDEERFYARLLVNPSADPEEVAKTLHEANDAYEKKVLEAYLQEKGAAQKSFVETPSGSQIRVPEGKEPASLAEAKRAALERLAKAASEK
jgi:hypothetical protein